MRMEGAATLQTVALLAAPLAAQIATSIDGRADVVIRHGEVDDLLARLGS